MNGEGATGKGGGIPGLTGRGEVGRMGGKWWAQPTLRDYTQLSRLKTREFVLSKTVILDGRLWPRIGLDHAPTENLKFRDDLSNQGHFANQLLLYDSIIFPTNDFGIVPALVSWLGLETFLNAVESGTFSFLRQRGVLGYVGNGNGVNTLEIKSDHKKSLADWQEAMFGDTEKSLAIQLKMSEESIPTTERQRVLKSVQAVSLDYKYDNEFFMKNIAHESYVDIIKTPRLVRFVRTTIPHKTGHIDLTRLPGVDANQAKFSSLGKINDPVELVLRVAEMNLEIAMSAFVGDCDLFTCEGADELLINKLHRAGISEALTDSFLTLLELNNIPDIEQGIYTNKCTLRDIWAVRETQESRLFREWLREASSENLRELEKEYVAALSNTPAIASLPAKVIRFCVTGLGGLLNPAVGPVLGAIDSFFVEKCLSGYNPKLFFDRLKNLDL